MTAETASSNICISCDDNLLDETFVYRYLKDNMYWAKSLTFDAFKRSLKYSAVVLGVYDRLKGNRQIGFARVVSDCATFAYLTDVFIVDTYRGKGLSKQLMQEVLQHPQLQDLRRFLLVTEDAGWLYAKFGFQKMGDSEHWMQIYNE